MHGFRWLKTQKSFLKRMAGEAMWRAGNESFQHLQKCLSLFPGCDRKLDPITGEEIKKWYFCPGLYSWSKQWEIFWNVNCLPTFQANNKVIRFINKMGVFLWIWSWWCWLLLSKTVEDPFALGTVHYIWGIKNYFPISKVVRF